MTSNETQGAKGFYKLSWLQRIGFGSGDLAQNLIYQTISMYLLFFYTNIYGLDPADAATMFLVVRLVDVLWDPLVGTYVDKHNPRLGKYRSYLVLGGIPLTGFAILCFWNGFAPSLIYAYVTYVGMSMLYTLINVPYGALNSSLTRDTDEITTLTSVRMFLANVGGLCVASGIPLVVAAFAPKDAQGEAVINTPDAAGAWFTTMAIYALVGLALLIFCFTQTKERVVMDAKDMEDVKVSDLWTEFVRNRPLRILAFFFITSPISDTHLSTLSMGQMQNGSFFSMPPKEKTPKKVPAIAKKDSLKKDSVVLTQNTELQKDTIKSQESVSTPKEQRNNYYVVLASQVRKKNAELYVEKLRRAGYAEAEVFIMNHVVRVVCGHYPSEDQAYRAVSKIRQKEEFSEAWVLKVKI